MIKRRIRSAAVEFNDWHRFHLLHADCLLAGRGLGCGCGLRNEDGTPNDTAARLLWGEHREEILATWRRMGHNGICWAQREFEPRPRTPLRPED